jgi:hypothetical protein
MAARRGSRPRAFFGCGASALGGVAALGGAGVALPETAGAGAAPEGAAVAVVEADTLSLEGSSGVGGSLEDRPGFGLPLRGVVLVRIAKNLGRRGRLSMRPEGRVSSDTSSRSCRPPGSGL